MGILFKSVTLFRQDSGPHDVLVAEGKITAIAREIPATNGHRIIHGSGKMLISGFVDLHTHLREPGFAEKETIATGTAAAAKGGYVRVCAMPNTNPVPDSPEVIGEIAERIRHKARVPVSIIAAATLHRSGQNACGAASLKAAGAIALSDDGSGVNKPEVMQDVLSSCAQADLPYFAHCEDAKLDAHGCFYDTMPAEAEYSPLARDLDLVAKTRAHYHLCHASTARSVELIREAKENGLPVTAEVTPHHLVLSAELIDEWSGLYKVNPPIREEAHRQALIRALQDGTIDCIATDHAPHTRAEKALPPEEAPFGFSGIELAFPLLYTKLVQRGEISLERLLTALIAKPRAILGLPVPELGLKKGETADLTLLDLETTRPVLATEMVSMGKNTPFIGENLCGWSVLTTVNGEIVYDNGGKNENANWTSRI